jgi:PhnB protein
MAGASLPEGYHSVNPYFVVEGAERLIEFLTDVFSGIEHGERELRSDGRINHTDVRIGDSIVMLSEASAEYPARSCVHYAYVDDVDATFRTALRAGATPIMKPCDQPYGDRVAGFYDPFGNRWWVATHIRDFS